MSDEQPEMVDVTITAPDVDWLRQHCAILVEQRLAASANIITTVESIYRWEGEIHYADEALAIIHTRATCVDRIAELTNELHPYEVPHVQVLGTAECPGGYAQWILDNTIG